MLKHRIRRFASVIPSPPFPVRPDTEIHMTAGPVGWTGNMSSWSDTGESEQSGPLMSDSVPHRHTVSPSSDASRQREQREEMESNVWEGKPATQEESGVCFQLKSGGVRTCLVDILVSVV